MQRVAVRVLADHGPVPFYTIFHHFFFCLNRQIREGKHIIGSSDVIFGFNVSLIPLGDEPLVIANRYLVVTQTIDVGFDIHPFLDVFLVKRDCCLELFAYKELIGLGKSRVVEGVHSNRLVLLNSWLGHVRIIFVIEYNKRIIAQRYIQFRK